MRGSAIRGVPFWLALILISNVYIVRAQDDDEATVKVNLPQEVPIQGLIDYVSERLEIHILYDEKIAQQKITVRAPGEVPVSSLLSVLQSALRMKGLTIVDADAPGWKKIVEATRLPEVAIAGNPKTPLESFNGATAVTQTFVLAHVDPSKLEETIKPFLSSQGANTIAMKEHGVLIVTDYASNLVKLARLIELIDRPRRTGATRFLKVAYHDASSLAQQLSSMIEARNTARGQASAETAGVAVLHDSHTNQLIIFGEQDEVAQVVKFAETLDVPSGTRTEVYAIRHTSADRVNRLARSLLGNSIATTLKTVVDEDENLLIVSGSADTQSRMQQLVQRLDRPRESSAKSRVQIYKLRHIKASDALKTIRAIEDTGTDGASSDVRPGQTDGRYRLLEENVPPGPNRPQLQPQRELATPPAFREQDESPGTARSSARAAQLGSAVEGNVGELTAELVLRGARIAADKTTNSLIVVADPSVQAVFTELIRSLDTLRPQVLIEARVVILDTTDDFSLGVELSGGDREGSRKLFSFSSFGLSQVDRVTGALAIAPGVGFNGALVDPSVADVVIRAFTRHRRARVVSAPRVLVNDNATGLLASVTEIPFTSVNASQTVSTTSFAGFADAGTTIRVTPHIGEKDQLQLEYQITLNEFQGQVSSDGVPPPRQTDEVESIVTIPDGHTLIVGGLNRVSRSTTIDSIPYLERVPVLKHAVRSKSRNARRTSLFVFLRPIILRDDKFRALKYLSERNAREAGAAGSFPRSKPMLIR